jgi:hypothetical protein
MKIIYNDRFPREEYLAMTIFPFIFARDELSEIDINHEHIHGHQQIEMTLASFFAILITIVAFDWSAWWVLLSLPVFYVWYGIEYIVRFIMYSKQKEAYRNISFEQEAYLHEGDLTYLKRREPFSWFKYMFQKTYIYQKPTL